jgi:hypothetical protein
MATLSTAAKNAALSAITGLSYSFSTFRPTSPDVNLTTNPPPAFGTPSGGSVSVTPATYLQATNTGVAARFVTNHFTLTVGGPGSGSDIEISPSANITTGLRVRLNSLTLTFP